MSNMKSVRSQAGSMALAASLAVTVILLFGATSFGYWAYQGRQDYKNNVDAKVATAVTAAKLEESKAKDIEFAEISKSPLKLYQGPEAFGSIKLLYPKTWSGYVINSTDNAPYIDGYFSPGVVPDVEADGATFAVRLRVEGETYSTTLASYQSGVQDGSVKISPYKLPQVKGVVGSKIVGTLDDEKQGTLILLPLRANSLEIWTNSDKYLQDFNKYILPNLSFSP